MSVKQLDFSKPNLVIDLKEVKKMFEVHLNAGCRYLVKQTLSLAHLNSSLSASGGPLNS